VAALPGMYGDLNIFRQVWVNLISNAVKYSGGHSSPLIEIGANQTATENIFFTGITGLGSTLNTRENYQSFSTPAQPMTSLKEQA